MNSLGRALQLIVGAVLLVAMMVTHSHAGGGQRSGGARHSGSHGGSHHHSHGHGRVIIGVGPWWGPGWWGPYYGYPYYPYYPYYSYYPYYPYYPYSPAVAEPSTYVQREVATESAPPPSYWYYCESARGYYPTVQTCPEIWLKVAPLNSP
jgi:hypothetical protein